MIIADAISVNGLLCGRMLWIDVVVLALAMAVHAIANFKSPGLGKAEDARQQSFMFVKELASGGVTTVGILLPLSVTAVGILVTQEPPLDSALADLFIANVWFTVSLVLGLVVLWTSGYRAHTANVQNLRLVRLCSGWQLIFLLAGVVRLLIATYVLVQSAT